MSGRRSASLPAFIDGSAMLEAAHTLAAGVHRGAERTPIEHPVAVAELLDRAGYGESVVAAALLHDVVEDGGPGLAELEDRFGHRVAGLVGKLTEDGSIASFSLRKSVLRARAATDGHDAAAIFAADKLATVTSLLERGERAPAAKLDHYERSLLDLRAFHPEVPFLDELAAGLAHLRELAMAGS